MSETKSLTRGQWLTLAAAFLGWMFDGVEIGMTPLVARPALQDLLRMADESQVARWISVLMACFSGRRGHRRITSAGWATRSAGFAEWSPAC